MGLQLLYLAIGLGLIVKGGDLFVGASVRIAELLKMPRIVIGSTLVSLATTTPELVVSIMSGDRHQSGLALGNAVGSCLCNIGLILGATAAIRQIDVHLRVLKIPLLAMMGAALLLLVVSANLRITQIQGGLLLALGIGYFVFDFSRNLKSPKPEAIREARAIERAEAAAIQWVHTPLGTAIVFLFGTALVIVGSRLLVDSAVAIAVAMGIPSIVIGLTVVALGTSLPELVTAISSARRRVSDLSVGNILGANVANLTLIVGSAAGISDVTMSRVEQLFNVSALLVFMCLLFWFIASKNRISRREGGVLVGFYGIYLVVVVAMSMGRQ